MASQQTTRLTEILSDVLADLAFMMIDDEPVAAPLDDELLETVIAYRGPEEGSLLLHCGREFSVALAANLLGLNPDDPDAGQRSQDAVAEFMNIICGQAVTRLYGTEATFDLTIPKVSTCACFPGPENENDADVAVLNIEGHWVRLLHRAGPLVD